MLRYPLWLLLGLAPLVGGCDMLVAGLAMPGLAPGVGTPVTGRVLDARTRLPVGGATVTGGLGATLTAADGGFKLYGSLGASEVSVSRAGYVNVTRGGLRGGDSPEFLLTPVFERSQVQDRRFLNLKGRLVGAGPGNAIVSFGGETAAVTGGVYALSVTSLPSQLMTGVLAGGEIEGTYAPGAPFSFKRFAHQLVTFPLAATANAASPPGGDLNLPARSETRDVRVTYANFADFVDGRVMTSIELDFGVAGSVPVAAGTGTSQTLPVPTVRDTKYVVLGEAVDRSGTLASKVSITTNDPGQAAFQLLSPPRPVEPAPGAKAVGARPRFKWTAVPGAEIVYALTLWDEEGKVKWAALTPDTEIGYPAFSPSDVNAGTLVLDKPGAPGTPATYTWKVEAVDMLSATEFPSGRRGRALPVTPYRLRQRVSSCGPFRFSP